MYGKNLLNIVSQLKIFFRNSKYFFAIKGLCYRKVLLLLRLVGYQGQRVCYAPRDQFANSLLHI